MEIKQLLHFMRPKSRSILGLDIRSTDIKMLALAQDGISLSLECFGSSPLPPNTVNSHLINKVEVLADSIKSLLDALRPNSKQVVLAIPDTAIISKVLSVHKDLTDEDMEEFILFEASKYLPYPIDEINLDFQVLGSMEHNPSLQEVLVVASRKEQVMLRVEAAIRAGLEVLVVDVASYALARALEQGTKNVLTLVQDKPLIILDLNETSTHLMLFQGMKLVYSREEEMTDFEKNKDSKEQVLVFFKKNVLVWIKRALHFYYTTSRGGFADCCVLIGSLAGFQGLSDLVEDQLALLSIVGNPFSAMHCGKHSLNEDAPEFMLACGLALRGLESYARNN